MKKIILVNVWLLLFGLSMNGQTRTISGNVKDSFEPLIGANVLIKGSGNGTVTDFDGNYTLDNVSDDDVLIFSYTGYTPQEVVAGDQTVINITLQAGVEMEEVIIVGYGTKRRVTW